MKEKHKRGSNKFRKIRLVNGVYHLTIPAGPAKRLMGKKLIVLNYLDFPDAIIVMTEERFDKIVG